MSGKRIKIFNDKLYFRKNANAKINSFENFDYQPKISEFQIFNDQLPWLRYNKPNLSDELKNQITKKEYPDYKEYKFDRIKQKNYDSQVHSHSLGGSSPKLIVSKVNTLSESNMNTKEKVKDVENTRKPIHNDNVNMRESDVGRKKQQVNDKIMIYPNMSQNKNSKVNISTETNNLSQKSSSTQSTSNKEYLKLNQLSNQKTKVNVSTGTDTVNHVSVETQAISNHNTLKLNKLQGQSSIASRSTETDKVQKVAVEIQTTSNENIGHRNLKKLKQSMTNSITISDKDKTDVKSISYLRKHRTQKVNFKKKTNMKHDRYEDLITNEIIDSILPSLSHPSVRSHSKQYSAYTFQSPHEKILTDRSPDNVSHPWSVTHVSVDYLDQYWAFQRQNKIKKDNFHYHNKSSSADDLGNTSIEKEKPRFPPIDSYNDYSNFQRIYDNNLNNRTQNIVTNENNFNYEYVDLITDRDLAKIMV